MFSYCKLAEWPIDDVRFVVGRPGVQFSCRVIPKGFKNGIYIFPAWRSAFTGGCREQAGKFACCVLGKGT